MKNIFLEKYRPIFLLIVITLVFQLFMEDFRSKVITMALTSMFFIFLYRQKNTKIEYFLEILVMAIVLYLFSRFFITISHGNTGVGYTFLPFAITTVFKAIKKQENNFIDL